MEYTTKWTPTPPTLLQRGCYSQLQTSFQVSLGIIFDLTRTVVVFCNWDWTFSQYQAYQHGRAHQVVWCHRMCSFSTTKEGAHMFDNKCQNDSSRLIQSKVSVWTSRACPRNILHVGCNLYCAALTMPILFLRQGAMGLVERWLGFHFHLSGQSHLVSRALWPSGLLHASPHSISWSMQACWD